MEENLNKNIQGEITKIYSPKNGDFGFNDFQRVSFMLKASKEYYLCTGEAFQIFEGEFVKVEGIISETSKGKKLDFNKIAIEISGVASKTKYLKYICGASRYKSLCEAISSNSGRDFSSKEEETKYCNDHLISYLETENYSALMNAAGVGDTNSRKLVANYAKNAKLGKLYDDLAQYGLNLKDCNKILKSKTFGSSQDVAEVVKRNPFKLMEAVGFSFSKCDILFSKNGGTYNAIPRVLASVTASLKQDMAQGHSFSTNDILYNKCNKMLNSPLYDNKTVDMNEINACLVTLAKYNKITLDNKGRIYFTSVFEKENDLREFVKNALSIPANNFDYKPLIENYEKANGIKFGREQKMAIENSMNNRVSIITGGPGTGKTSSLACIMQLLMEHEGIEEDDIALCAPTGKAAKRMMESINGALGTQMIATTIHSLLETDPKSPNLSQFKYNKNNKLSKAVIVVDEASMIDENLAWNLLTAIKSATKLILLGDIEQLPPVDYGYFLRDMIDSKIPTVKLLEVHRQKGDSSIIDLSQKISRETLSVDDCAPKKDFRFFSLPKEEDYKTKLDWIVDLFLKSVQKVGIEQTMILTPICGEAFKANNAKSMRFGCQQLCLAIQDKYLPYVEGQPEFEKNGWVFRIGSKVIVTKNDKTKGIVNGEIGYIEEIDSQNQTITVNFEGKNIILEEEQIETLRLAYAITVHKSQGSEWKSVIYCCFGETVMNKKPLVYTAITRAKKSLVVVGDIDAFVNCIHNKEEVRRSRILN